jgi:hypothetical protein
MTYFEIIQFAMNVKEYVGLDKFRPTTLLQIEMILTRAKKQSIITEEKQDEMVDILYSIKSRER